MTKNVLHCGDNLEILATMEKESVDLIYIDPPFFSNRHYEIICGDEAEIRSFEDRWEGGPGINQGAKYGFRVKHGMTMKGFEGLANVSG